MSDRTIHGSRPGLAGKKRLLCMLGLGALLMTAIVIDPGATIPASGAEQFLEALPKRPVN